MNAPQPRTALELLLAEIELRAAAEQHLADYARRVVGVEPATHHQYICDELERGILNDEWDDCVICLPPGGAKSTYASHCLPAWFLGHFPDNNVILASHTATLAEKWSRRVRDTVASPEHTRVFEHSTLSKDSTSVSKWSTSKNGEFLAAGVGMSILGFRADLAVLDDPVSGWEQAQSTTQLEKIHNWFKADLKSRLKPSAKIIVICQRTAAYDMAGYVMKEYAENPTRRLRTIVLPMLAGENDPLGRAPGERLWPTWYTPEMVTDLQKDEFIWKTMWQQEPPSDAGSWITTEDIQHRPTPIITSETPVYGLTDLALSVNTGDYTVHFIVGVDPNGDWDILEADRKRVDPEVTATRIISYCETYSPREWLIDDDNTAKVMIPLVATKAQQLHVAVPWKMLPMRGQDKETRAAPLRGQFKRRKIYYPADAPFAHWLTKELLTFPNAVGSGVDDGIDALGLLGRRMAAIRLPVHTVAPPVKQGYSLNDLWDDMPQQSTRM